MANGVREVQRWAWQTADGRPVYTNGRTWSLTPDRDAFTRQADSIDGPESRARTAARIAAKIGEPVVAVFAGTTRVIDIF